MNHVQELFQGPIAHDYREILDSVPLLDTATKAKVSTGKGCSAPRVCPAKATTGKGCSATKVCPAKANTGKNCSAPRVCPGKPTTGKGCSGAPKVCPKATAEGFQSAVPAWSNPPVPPLG